MPGLRCLGGCNETAAGLTPFAETPRWPSTHRNFVTTPVLRRHGFEERHKGDVLDDAQAIAENGAPRLPRLSGTTPAVASVSLTLAASDPRRDAVEINETDILWGGNSGGPSDDIAAEQGWRQIIFMTLPPRQGFKPRHHATGVMVGAAPSSGSSRSETGADRGVA